MANRGIGETFSSLVHSVDNAGTINLNISYEDYNLYLNIPLFSINSQKTFSTSLIYYQQGEHVTSNEMFPRFMRLSFYKVFSKSGSVVTVTNADGSVDIFNEIGDEYYYCSKNYTKIKLTNNNSKVNYYNNDGSYYIYGIHENYPSSFTSLNSTQNSLVFTLTNHKITKITMDGIDSNHQFVVYFVISNTDGYVSSILIKQKTISDNQTTYQTLETILYSYGSTTNLDLFRFYKGAYGGPAVAYRLINLYFDLSTNVFYAIKDDISKLMAEYHLSSDHCDWFRIAHINDEYLDSLKNNISYAGLYAKVNFYDGSSSILYFNAQHLPSFAIDQSAVATAYQFNKYRHLIYQSKPICLDKNANITSLLKNNKFFDVGSYWNPTLETTSYFSYPFPYSTKVGTQGLVFNGLSQSVIVSGLPGDAYTFSVLIAGIGAVHCSNYVKISLKFYDENNNIVAENYATSLFISGNQRCELLSVSTLSYKAFSKVEVFIVDEDSTRDWIINQAWLLKSYPNVSAEYGEKGNLLSFYQKANETRFSYDSYGRQLVIGSSQGSKVISGYSNTENSPIYNRLYNDFSFKQNVAFNSSNMPTHFYAYSCDSSCYMMNSKTYNDFLRNSASFDGTTLYSYTFNDYGDIENISNSYNNEEIQYFYQTNCPSLISSIQYFDQSLLDKYSFAYNNNFLLASCKNNLMVEYIPTYNSVDMTTAISFRNDGVSKPIIQFVYSNNCLRNLVGKYYGTSGHYSFLYDDLNRLTQCSSSFSGQPSISYSIIYDSYSRIKSIEDYVFTYNDNGDIINFQNGNFNIHINHSDSVSIDKQYVYSDLDSYHLNNISKSRSLYLSRQTDLSSFQLHKGITSTCLYPHFSQSAEDCLDMYGHTILKAANYIYFTSSVTTLREGSLYCVSFSNHEDTCSPYYIVSNKYSNPGKNGNIYGFWFKLTSYDHLNKTPLMSVELLTTFNDLISRFNVLLYNNHIVLEYKVSGVTSQIIEGPSIVLNEWTYLSLSFNFDSNNTLKFIKLRINENIYSYDASHNRFAIPPDNEMICEVSYFGHGYGEEQYHQMGSFTALFMSTNGLYFDDEEEREIYFSSYCLIHNIPTSLNADPNNTSISSSRFINESEKCLNINGVLDVIPLIDGFSSVNGNSPIVASLSYDLNYFGESSFLYNQTSKQFSYYAMGTELSYRYKFQEFVSGKTSGTISANITPITHTNQKRCIFQIGINFALFINSTGYLCYAIGNNEVTTNLFFSADTSKRVTVTWMNCIAPESVPSNNTIFTIHLGNQQISFTYNASISWLDFPKISFGINFSGGDYPLYGFIDSIVITKSELNEFQIIQLDSNFNSVKTISKYSEFGFLKMRSVYSSDEIFTQSFDYIVDPYQHPILLDSNIRDETIVFENNHSSYTISTKYIYDGLHRLTGITPFNGSTSNNVQYTYDTLNRLIRSNQSDGDDLTYNYDSTHNIVSVINNHSSATVHSMTYSMNRMISFDNYSLTYDSNYVFNPYQYGSFDNNNVLTNGLTFTFMGKRLMNITKTGTFDIPSMSFAYDYSGKRLSKTVNGVLHQYYYDGDNLVYETETDTSTSTLLHEKKFFYDENGILTFMELDGVRYFYYIDATHIVRGLFNSNGQLIVKYFYDAWGNVTNIIDNSSISLGTLNPFLFKCYYYDHESKWYYCLTRYYIPLWMRWLTIDDSSYLTSEVPAGYNLYVYCNNNPIMFEDPNGEIIISLLVFGFIFGLIIGAGVSAISQGITNGWDNINIGQVALDGLIGGISGLLAFSGIGALGSALISGALGFMGSVGGDLISSNGDWSQVNWFKAAVMTATNFVLGYSPGMQNAKTLGNSLFKSIKDTKICNIFKSAIAKYNAGQMTKKGLQGVFNLYGGSLALSVINSVPMMMIDNFSSALLNIIGNNIVNGTTTLFFSY